MSLSHSFTVHTFQTSEGQSRISCTGEFLFNDGARMDGKATLQMNAYWHDARYTDGLLEIQMSNPNTYEYVKRLVLNATRRGEMAVIFTSHGPLYNNIIMDSFEFQFTRTLL
jgi:hypothetical protein